MIIKEFARLCGCTTQTLRYYDKIDLLKPVAVDPWSGYRYYDPQQALAFVKIKNLQAADFSIQEIKLLLTCSDLQICEAFDVKIAQQTQKLAHIREIQQSYLAEKNTMEQIIHSMTDYMLSHCTHAEVLTEFGLCPSDAPTILELLKKYLNSQLSGKCPADQVSLTVDDQVFHGQAAVLEQIHHLTKENLGDTILLNTAADQDPEPQPDPDFSEYDCIWEQRGWAHVYDFIDVLPGLEQDKTYCLWLRVVDPDHFDDLSFSLFLMGSVLHKQQLTDAAVNCSVCAAEDGVNHFKLLCKK